MYLSFADDDFEGTLVWLDSVESRGGGTVYDRIQSIDERISIQLAQGQIDESAELFREMNGLQRNRIDWSQMNRSRLADSLFMELDLEFERAPLTGDFSKMRTAFDAYTAELDKADIPDDAHGPYNWIAMLASFLGETEKALEYRALHNAYHQREGDDVEAFGRIHDAIVEAKTGGDIDFALAEIQAGAENIGCYSEGCWQNVMGEIEESRGNREKAMEHYMAYTDGFRLFKLRMDEGTIATTNFRLGALNEELGNLDEAIRRYTYFADRWNDADADLQPQVAEARRRIGVLLDRKAQEN
ncbi:MAG TPA: hypothetical protein DCY57_03140 [Bacteroidetes bacterium]|jgi:tetratricopeptide (TPR) repeat protein|nr:hypothetical protein [Bacteroidota bacterium]